MAATSFALATLATCLLVGECALRILSSRTLLVLDVEMWRYARQVKAPSAAPGLVEIHRPDGRAHATFAEALLGSRHACPAGGPAAEQPVAAGL